MHAASLSRRPVSDIAREWHGVVTSSQLAEAGYSMQQIQTMVRKGYLHRVRRGVYVVGHLALGDDARRMVAVASAGTGAALSGVSAGSCWQLTRLHDRVVEVVVPQPRRPIGGARFEVDSRLPSSAFAEFRNIPILTPTWTIVSLAGRFGPGDLTRVLREASYREVLDLPELVRICDGDDRRVGIPALRAAIELRMSGSSGYASRLERDLNRYVRAKAAVHPLPNLVIDGLSASYEVDMVWQELRICCEIDGPIHDDPDVRRVDAARTADLEAAKWTVIRIHWSDWESDRSGAVEPLLELIAERASLPTGA